MARRKLVKRVTKDMLIDEHKSIELIVDHCVMLLFNEHFESAGMRIMQPNGVDGVSFNSAFTQLTAQEKEEFLSRVLAANVIDHGMILVAPTDWSVLKVEKSDTLNLLAQDADNN